MDTLRRPATLLLGPLLGVLLSASSLLAGERPERLEFTRMLAHWSDYADPGYLPFVEDTRAELVQVGFYGAHFWSLVDTPFGNGYPAHLPVRGHRECAAWFARLNSELHRRGVKVVGHFNVKFLVGDPAGPEGPRGFFRFYRDEWNEAELGPKPVADPMELLEIDRHGNALSNSTYSIGGMREYWACLNNPHWRQVLKAWTRFAIQQGVDGLVSNYFYRHDCHCRYCVDGFKSYLRERFSRGALRKQFGIEDLDRHEFDEIVAWHDPAASTPLRREMLRFSQISNKRAFDEVLIEFGRSLKPDLIVAQWNHLGDFSQIGGDERCLLPAALWGRGEDYLWYSTGDNANRTDLAAGQLGEGTLQARYLRGAFGDKPFTLGKYEGTRIRAAIAELAANGGAPMGFYTAFTDPAARAEIVRYYRFLARYDDLFHANHPAAEVLLRYPRTRVQAGDLSAVDRFRRLGRQLLDDHVLFEVEPDDLPKRSRELHPALVIDLAKTAPSATNGWKRLPAARSRFVLPASVRVSASRPRAGGEFDLHFVNYNREEPVQKGGAGRGIVDEKPIAVSVFSADLAWPGSSRVRQVELITPESPDPLRLTFTQDRSRVRFSAPGFLVYAVVRVQLETR
jgi:hypothetical protein